MMSGPNDANYYFSTAAHWSMVSLQQFTCAGDTLSTATPWQLGEEQATDNDMAAAHTISCSRSGAVYGLSYTDELIEIAALDSAPLGAAIRLDLDRLNAAADAAAGEQVFDANSIFELKAGGDYLWLLINNIKPELAEGARAHDYFLAYVLAIKPQANTASPEFAILDIAQHFAAPDQRGRYKARYLAADIDAQDHLWLLANTDVATETLSLDDSKLSQDKAATLFSMSAQHSNISDMAISADIYCAWTQKYEAADLAIAADSKEAWLVTKPYGTLAFTNSGFWQIEKLSLEEDCSRIHTLYQSTFEGEFRFTITAPLAGHLALWDPLGSAVDIYQLHTFSGQTPQLHKSASLRTAAPSDTLGDMQWVDSGDGEPAKLRIVRRGSSQYLFSQYPLYPLSDSQHSQGQQATLITPLLKSPDQGSVKGWLRADLEVDFSGATLIEISVASLAAPLKHSAFTQLQQPERRSWSSLLAYQEATVDWKTAMTRTYRADQWQQQKLFFPLHQIREPYLYLRVRILHQQAGESTVLRSLKITWPERSLVNYLPGIYRQNTQASETLRDYFTMFDCLFNDLRHTINSTPNSIAKPSSVDWYSYLLSWFGLPQADELPAAQQRSLLKAAVNILQRQGTLLGLQIVLDIISDHQALAFDKAQNTLFYPHTSDGESVLIIVASELTEQQRIVLQRFLVDYIPVTTNFTQLAPADPAVLPTADPRARATLAYDFYSRGLPVPNIDHQSDLETAWLEKLHAVRIYVSGEANIKSVAQVNNILSYFLDDIAYIPPRGGETHQGSFIVEHVGQRRAQIYPGYQVEIKISDAKQSLDEIHFLLPWLEELVHFYIPNKLYFRLSFLTPAQLESRKSVLHEELTLEFPLMPFPEMRMGSIELA